MKIVITLLAQHEFNDAKEYYEIEQSGLGTRFGKEIKSSLLRINDYPYAWPLECKEIRRYILHKFPFKILYSIYKDKIIIIAFAHLHRKPNYWIDRI